MKTLSARFFLLPLLIVLFSPLPQQAAAATASHSPAGTALAEGRFTWPLYPEPAVLRGFRPPAGPYAPGHRGVDLAAQSGQDVLAADAGVVVFAGRLADRGVVSIEHDGGLRTTYEPVVPTVAVGSQVFQGQSVAAVAHGHAGCARPCLHWGVRRDARYVNPLSWIAEMTAVRLKPWND